MDIVAKDEDGTVCFIEVKTRRGVEAGLPDEANTEQKQRRFERIALCWMMVNDYADLDDVRFDSIGICVIDDHKAVLRHQKRIFDSCI